MPAFLFLELTREVRVRRAFGLEGWKSIKMVMITV